MAAALRVFVAKGFHEASIVDDESGVSVGAIHDITGARTS